MSLGGLPGDALKQLGWLVCANGSISDRSKTHVFRRQVKFGLEAVAVAAFPPRAMVHPWQHLQ